MHIPRLSFTALLAALLLALAGSARAQSTVWVDIVHGLDLPSSGSATQPYRTLGYAIGQLPAPTPFTIFNLRPGRYEPAGGEVFPLQLPDGCIVQSDPAVTTERDRRVVLSNPAGRVFEARPNPTGGGSSFLRFHNLVVEASGGEALDVAVTQFGVTATIELTHCRFDADLAVHVTARNAAFVDLRLQDCWVHGIYRSIAVDTDGGSIGRLFVDRTVVDGGNDEAIRLDGLRGGDIIAVLRGSRVLRARERGVHTLTGGAGQVTVGIEHCLFYGIGMSGAGGRGGALVDTVGPLAAVPTYRIDNSIFQGNRMDAPTVGAGYVFGSNLVEQPNLVGVGRNVAGPTTFVDESTDDFHLVPGALGIDAGDLAVTMFADLDGDPRVTSATGLPDLGPDEIYDHYVYAKGDLRLGQVAQIRAITGADLQFGLLVGAGSDSTFGTGTLHLTGALVATTLVGQASSAGVGRVSFPMPMTTTLVGVELWWQGVFAEAPYFGSNAWRTVIVP